MTCSGKHIKYQPTEAELICPSCGAPELYVEWSDYFDCPSIHPDDGLECAECGMQLTASDFVKQVVKQKKIVPCKHCKGKGWVKP